MYLSYTVNVMLRRFIYPLKCLSNHRNRFGIYLFIFKGLIYYLYLLGWPESVQKPSSDWD